MLLTIRLATLALLLLFATVALAQGGHTVQGRVVAPSGSAPNQSVRVVLTFAGRPVYETFTDLSGRFSFSGIGTGTYELTVDGDDATFETTSLTIEVSGSTPQMFTENIQLRPLRAKPTARIGVINSFSQVVPKAAQQSFERAVKLDSEGRTEESIKALTDAIQNFPDYFDAHLMLGKLFLNANRLPEATTELDRAREINPKDDRAYQSFGLILMLQRNFAVAVAVFAEAARLNPTNPVNVLLKTKALINQAYSIDPAKSAQAANDRSYLLGRAESSLKQLADLSKNKMSADHFSLAMFFEMKGDRKQAANELEALLRENPDLKNASEIREAIQKLRAPPPVP
ncbi:MAG TPA: tetratricopeptide repeat protein [Pyrinomonadaceae bacterium]|nr:tetratricopeptide repeat protein [Pyrinomonadaceae bacterium]